MKTEKRGGKRIASPGKKIGRPTKESTRVLNFRVPVKEYDRLKPLVGEYLASLLKAAEIGEVSMIDARHILKVGFDCHKCKHSFSNPFDQYYCQKIDENGEEYDLEAGKDCKGIYYER